MAKKNGKANGHAFVGQRFKRKEDPRLIQGISHYADDLRLPGLLHCVFVRSPHAHAKISSIGTDAAKAAPGVVAVFTGNDVKDIGCVPCAGSLPGLKIPNHYVLARDRVRYVGEPVAVIAAETLYQARDAADLVEVDYEPLPAIVDMEKALAKGSPYVHDEFKTNLAFTHVMNTGDVAAAFKKADVVVNQRLVNQRLAPVSMEPRGVVAQYLPGEKALTVWSSTQIPHLLKTQMAVMLGVPETSVRVITPEVGGGFGSKLNVYGEEGVVPWLAIRLGRPVKWSETRRENIAATIHGRDQINDVELALKKDGTLLGMRCHVLADLGAYHQLLTPIIATLTGLMAPGCYKLPAFEFVVKGVFTNKMSTDAYRGAGRPEATYLIERMADIAARELKMDPVAFRRKNFPSPKEFPFATAAGLQYDSGNYQGTLAKATQIAGYDKLRARQKAGWKQGKYYGIGVSTYVEICALGPSSAMPAGGWESGTVRIEPTGKVTALTGASPHGQGQETSFAQLIADMLGITPADVNVVHGDTAAVPYGIGTFGSRATAVGGTALYVATEKLQDKMKKIAAHLLGARPDAIVIGGGRLTVKGSKKSLSFGEVVGAAYSAKSLPEGVEPGLEATHFFEPRNFTFPFGAHIVCVEVDRDTGAISLDRYVAVDDCGNVINPLLVEGQIHGGIVQGIAQALYEEVIYNEDGQLSTGTLMDYALPKAAGLPEFELERTCTPTPVNPMGVKGVGEAGTIGCTPAVVNAVCDALAPLGIRHIDMPLKPEKVWRAMQGGSQIGATAVLAAAEKKAGKASSRRRA
ncbi:MAG TPA: xanthine dehydrogenase family protein molybdopterin-binding subunit [Terriglobales bacterium]|nr:xanthine dehydrogenase family protein molybdopterin-binding subunit [Terriglobales bacterium]